MDREIERMKERKKDLQTDKKGIKKFQQKKREERSLNKFLISFSGLLIVLRPTKFLLTVEPSRAGRCLGFVAAWRNSQHQKKKKKKKNSIAYDRIMERVILKMKYYIIGGTSFCQLDVSSSNNNYELVT